MNSWGKSLMVLVGMLGGSALAGAERAGPVMELHLKDGSQLMIIVESPRIPLMTNYGKVAIPSALVKVVKYDPESGKATVEVVNKDRISGRISSPELRVRNALGSLSVRWDDVRSLGVGAGAPAPTRVTRRPAVTSAVRFDITLRDGSCLLGTPGKQSVGFQSALGRCDLPWALVRGVTFHDDGEMSTVRFWSGDSIVGCIDWATCPVETGVGSGHVSSVATSEIGVSLGGVDLVAKPWASVTGNRHFMGAVRNDAPRRIGGRARPASQFIEAHAGGRIEYVFDEPVTEFRAIATFYESYCANKGRVIFRVETEQGEVHATRSMRNLEREEIHVRFAPTRRLVLVTDSQGSADEDWSVWLWPEAR